jgi:hypothetical protein
MQSTHCSTTTSRLRLCLLDRRICPSMRIVMSWTLDDGATRSSEHCRPPQQVEQ